MGNERRNKIQMTGGEIVNSIRKMYLRRTTDNKIQTGERALHIFPVPVAVVTGKAYV